MPERSPKPQSVQFHVDIDGVATQFVITDFGSQLFFVITQSSKIGSLIEASASELEEGSEKIFDVKVLFGDRRLEHYRTYARALIEIVSKRCTKSVLLGIALREHSADVFRQVLRAVQDRIAPVTLPPPDEDDFVPE